MVVGEARKFLSAIITLKCTQDMKAMKPSRELSQECMIHMKNNVKDGEKIKTTDEAI